MRRTRLVVLFGGRSAEHDVSCVSAASVLGAVDLERYDVVPVGITREGRWLLASEAQKLLEGGRRTAVPASLAVQGPEVGPLEVIGPAGGAGGRGGGDGGGGGGGDDVVVLPLLHGPFGEDGTVQGLCELAGVAYVGSGVLGSAVCMDKIVAKRMLRDAGLAQADFLGVREWDVDERLPELVEARLGWPVFVKPANLGSSIGVSRAGGPAELRAAVEAALAYDEWVVVEEAVAGREIECAVLGDRHPQASVPGEIRASREFYDYDDKYVTGAADLVVPAVVSPEVTADAQRLALAAFAALRAEGMARVDMFYEEGGRGLLVNEVNTIPGFTPISMYPRLWAESGVPYPELIDRLVDLALERHARRSNRARGAPRGR